jgi:hypothetical protein
VTCLLQDQGVVGKQRVSDRGLVNKAISKDKDPLQGGRNACFILAQTLWQGMA